MTKPSFKEAIHAFEAGSGLLQAFHPFPKACQREKYEALPVWLRRKLIAMGEEYLGFSYPSLPAADFMAFQRTGNRTDYEELYFARRYGLNALVAAECVEGCGRFIDDIINGIFAVCEESAWQLPAHNSYGREASLNILPDSSRPILDLFACETGAQLACIHYLLEAELDKVCPYVTKRIRQELERRIFGPYLQEHFWWMGNGDDPMCNWTPWCTQNILYSVFLCLNSHNIPSCLTNQEQISCRAVLRKASESCDCFLKDYGEDGCCDEGAQYYRHAGLCLHGCISVLNQVTGGAFTQLLSSDKIRNIAAYIFNVHVDDKYYFNFSDCSPIAGRAGVREYLFGKHTGLPSLMQFAAEDFRAAGEDIFSDESHRLNLFYCMQAVFCYEEILSFDLGAWAVHKDIYYPSVGLFLARDRAFSLAVKAGDNNDSHNHNDTGSITLYKNGRPILVDIGVESYTKKTFSPHRYEIWTMQSGYHNLPSIEGMDQRDGPRYRALDVHTDLTEKHALISMDLAGAYPLSEPGRFYTREVILHKDQDRITLTDTTNCGNVILNFIVSRKPEISENRIYTAGAVMEFNGGQLLTVETLAITAERLRTAWDHDLYRIRLSMTDRIFKLNIE